MPSSFVSRYKNTEFFYPYSFLLYIAMVISGWAQTTKRQVSCINSWLQINSAFNGFSHIYLPLSFIEVVKCTGEFLPHQRKSGMPFIVDGKRGRVQVSPRFLCRPTTLYIIARAVERQSAIYTEHSWFASPALGRHISTFRGYRILLTIRNPYINRFTNHFSIHS